MKYKRSTNTIAIEPEDTISQLAQITHSTVDEWIVFLEEMINEELKEWNFAAVSGQVSEIVTIATRRSARSLCVRIASSTAWRLCRGRKRFARNFTLGLNRAISVRGERGWRNDIWLIECIH